MAAVASRVAADSANSPALASPSSSIHDAHTATNGAGAPSTNAKAKKSKHKKAADPSETGKLLAAKINQLELDAAGEKDQEQEIGTRHDVCIA